MKLISSTQELQRFISVGNSFNLARLVPHVARVERNNIAKLIGRELFDEFAGAYKVACQLVNTLPEAERMTIQKEGRVYTLMPEEYHEPMVLLQDAVCNISFMNCIAQMQVTIGEEGVRLAVNQNQKTAFQWQIDDFKFQLANDGYNALDNFLLYLENNAEDFPSWKDSDSYFRQKDYFVETAELFNDGYHIHDSRMTYLSLRYIMKRIEQFEVKRIITPRVYDVLKLAQVTAFNAKQTVLMNNFLMPGIVLLTVAKGIIERAIEVSDLGVQINLYTYYATLKGASGAKMKYQNESDRDLMVEQLTKDGNEFLQKGREYIEANPDEFGELDDPVSETSFRVINKEERKIFGM